MSRSRMLALALIVASTLAALSDPSVAIKPDEPLYGAIAQDMWLRHDAVIPQFCGLPAFYKPPLLYWLGMLSMSALGPSTFALRIVPVLWGWGLLAATWVLARRLYDRDAAWLAVALVGTCMGFVAYARAFMMDLPLACCYVVICERWWVARTTGDQRAAATAIAVLGLSALWKGPVIGVIFLLGAGVTHVLHRGAIPMKGVLAGTVVAAAVMAVWPVLVWSRGLGPQLFHDFIWRENFGKFEEAHNSALVLFTSLLEGMLPWTFMAGAALLSIWRDKRYRDAAFAWPLLMAAAVLVVFLLPERKLPHYVLPALPLVLIAAAGALRPSKGAAVLTAVYSGVVGVLLLLGLRLAPHALNFAGLLLAALASLGVAALAIRRVPYGTAFAVLAALFWTGLYLGQDHLTTTLDPVRLRLAAGDRALCCGMEIGMATNDVVTPIPLVPIQLASSSWTAGHPLVIRRRDAAAALPRAEDDVRYSWWRWKDGIALGEILAAVRTGDTRPLQEEILLVTPAAGAATAPPSTAPRSASLPGPRP